MTARKRTVSKPSKTKAKAQASTVKVGAPKPNTRPTNPAPLNKTVAAEPSAKVGAPARGVKAVAPAPIVKVSAAKGRPMLSWVGKRPLREIPAYPAQEVERFSVTGPTADIDWSDWPDRYPHGGLLFHGDNKEVLAHLLANGFRGKVDLIYIDPPFDSGADYVRRVELRGARGTARLDGQGYTLGEQIQYTDIWANDTYLQFMYERLLLLRELMTPSAHIVLHCDQRRAHHLHTVMDEVFGTGAFVNEVIWKRSDAHNDAGQGARQLGTIHDVLLLFRADTDATWNTIFTPLPESTKERWYRHTDPDTGRRFNKADLTARKRGGDTEYEWKGKRPPVGRYWAYSRSNLERFEREGRLVYSKSGMPYLKRFLDESSGVALQDLWTDVAMLRGIHGEDRSGYPTEKPEPLLERIIRLLTNPGDLVLDCFIGSGTTAAVAQGLGRRWVGSDINKGAIQMTAKRLMERIEAQRGDGQGTLDLDDVARPAQLAFVTYRVNDYDLAIQHNEAVALAVEALGATRTQTDRFFDGTHGRKLLKIVPFDHPASPADLDEIARELRARPGEERDIVAVALGKVTACDGWLAAHNVRGAPNQIQLIELRTDPKYGKLFAHQPARAKVTVKREGTKAKIVIKEFISPTIVERLTAQEGIVAPKVTDWRQMVDSVLIDSSYDGAVFEVALADVPEKKDDFVVGTYEVDVSKGATTVAVKITDMLGEEVIVTAGI